MFANYHTHTWRCKHSDQVPDEAFVQAAISAGLKVLGFADHTPWPFVSGHHVPNVRMEVTQLAEYIQSINQLKEQYHEQIHIYVGLECEYYPAYYPWLESIKDQLDYLILGNHWPMGEENGETHFVDATSPADIDCYFDCYLNAIETGWFTYVAHPEIGLSSYQTFDQHCIDGSYRLCRSAKELGVPLEYNLYGLEKADLTGHPGLGYPCAPFWEIARDVGCQAIIGCDAHYLRHLSNPVYKDRAEEYLLKLGIELLQTLPGLE